MFRTGVAKTLSSPKRLKESIHVKLSAFRGLEDGEGLHGDGDVGLEPPDGRTSKTAVLACGMRLSCLIRAVLVCKSLAVSCFGHVGHKTMGA